MNKSSAENNDILRELVAKGNRRCFDCFEVGVTYVNMTSESQSKIARFFLFSTNNKQLLSIPVGSFCCTKCSGIL